MFFVERLGGFQHFVGTHAEAVARFFLQSRQAVRQRRGRVFALGGSGADGAAAAVQLRRQRLNGGFIGAQAV